VAGALFLAFCGYAVPLFLRMPLTNDAQMYDLQVRLLNEGGVLYRDILEPNLPGVVWIQAIVRKLAGWSSEALRAFDLLLLAGACWLINRWFFAQGWQAAGRILLVFAVVGFYVSQSEWCHCQRDNWLLLPVIGGLTLRRMQMSRFEENRRTSGDVFLLALLEGSVWGLAIWLKPHILIPAAGVWIVAVICVRPGKAGLTDALGLLGGGLLAGAAGILWMVQHECWLPFWETVREWNPRYFAAGREQVTLPRFLGMAWRLSPWIFLHIPAAVIAVRSIALAIQQRDSLAQNRALLAACYLGWTFQAFLLQHLFDYIHTAPIVLAILVVAGASHHHFTKHWFRAIVMAFAGLAVMASPLFSMQRFGLWATCLMESSNPRLYDELKRLRNPHWRDLDRIATFLAEQNPGQKEVCCFHSDLVSLYNRLHLMPPSRIVYVQEILVYFPDRREAILGDLETAPHRFVVTDIVSAQLTSQQIERLLSPEYQASLQTPSAKRRSYPWGHPIVFRSGNYLVHEVRVAALDSPPSGLKSD
jgi:hypothetical protein